MRIPLVRWSLGFDPKGLPELVFGLGFGLGGGSFAEGPLARGEAFFAPLSCNGTKEVVPGA